MKNLLVSFLKNKILLTWTAVAIFICAVLFMYKMLNETRVYVEFDKLRPFHEKAPVYFRGYKIGRVVKIQPTDNYQHTLVTIVLHPQNLQLPINTSAKLKMHKTRWLHKDYIDLIYPQQPDSMMLKRGSKIKGESSVDIHSYFASMSHESFEKMEENAVGILENLEDTTGMLYSVFAIINGILTEGENDIKNAMNNFSQTSERTTQIMKKIDNSISESQLKKTLDNIYETTSHAKTTIYNLSSPSENVSKIISNADMTLVNTGYLVRNLNEIVCGVKQTMKKRFSGLRFLFGKVIQ